MLIPSLLCLGDTAECLWLRRHPATVVMSDHPLPRRNSGSYACDLSSTSCLLNRFYIIRNTIRFVDTSIIICDIVIDSFISLFFVIIVLVAVGILLVVLVLVKLLPQSIRKSESRWNYLDVLPVFAFRSRWVVTARVPEKKM